MPEDAREIIKQEIANNGDGLPWKNKAHYASLMLAAATESYNAVPRDSSEIYFFDRGILDTLCYAAMIGIGISTQMDTLGKNLLYNKKVFILPPWKEIYQTDSERQQTWEEAKFTFTKMKETYLEYGYELIEVPQGTIQNRVIFILSNINSSY